MIFNLQFIIKGIILVASGVVSIPSNKPWIRTGDQYLYKRIFKAEALKKVYGAANQSI